MGGGCLGELGAVILWEGLIALGIVAVVVAAVGIWRWRVDGRMREVTRPVPAQEGDPEVDLLPPPQTEVLDAKTLGAPLGQRATLVQFSTAFCQPCRATRRILDEVSTMVDGVAHIELDAEAHLDLVRRFDIMRTPTVLVLDGTGIIRMRASGQPRKADVIAGLGAVIGD